MHRKPAPPPIAPPDWLVPGAQVHHREFGRGTVSARLIDTVLIQFPAFGEQGFLTPAASRDLRRA